MKGFTFLFILAIIAISEVVSDLTTIEHIRKLYAAYDGDMKRAVINDIALFNFTMNHWKSKSLIKLFLDALLIRNGTVHEHMSNDETEKFFWHCYEASDRHVLIGLMHDRPDDFKRLQQYYQAVRVEPPEPFQTYTDMLRVLMLSGKIDDLEKNIYYSDYEIFMAGYSNYGPLASKLYEEDEWGLRDFADSYWLNYLPVELQYDTVNPDYRRIWKKELLKEYGEGPVLNALFKIDNSTSVKERVESIFLPLAEQCTEHCGFLYKNVLDAVQSRGVAPWIAKCVENALLGCSSEIDEMIENSRDWRGEITCKALGDLSGLDEGQKEEFVQDLFLENVNFCRNLSEITTAETIDSIIDSIDLSKLKINSWWPLTSKLRDIQLSARTVIKLNNEFARRNTSKYLEIPMSCSPKTTVEILQILAKGSTFRFSIDSKDFLRWSEQVLLADHLSDDEKQQLINWLIQGIQRLAKVRFEAALEHKYENKHSNQLVNLLFSKEELPLRSYITKVLVEGADQSMIAYNRHLLERHVFQMILNGESEAATVMKNFKPKDILRSCITTGCSEQQLLVVYEFLKNWAAGNGDDFKDIEIKVLNGLL